MDYEHMYKRIVAGIPKTAVVVFDGALNYVMVGGADLLSAIGLKPEQMIGRSFFQIMPNKSYAARMANMYLDVIARGATRDEKIELGGRHYAVHAVPIEIDGMPHALSFSRDVTDEVKHREEVQHKNAFIRQYAEDNEEKYLRLKRQHDALLYACKCER